MSPRQRHRQRGRRSRGAAIIELAIVAPVLLLFFGISEFGLAWVSGNKLEGAVSTAARVGVQQGSVADADRNILLALEASLPEDLRANVDARRGLRVGRRRRPDQLVPASPRRRDPGAPARATSTAAPR